MTTTDRPFTGGPARRPETRQASDPAARNLQPISAREAADEPPVERLFAEKEISITIEVTPAGLTVRADYVGSLTSIPKAIERLKAAGVLELVQASAPVVAVAPAKAKRETVEPIYQPDGTACCPVHHKALVEGRYGLYCSAKAKEGEAQNDKGYCALRFS